MLLHPAKSLPLTEKEKKIAAQIASVYGALPFDCINIGRKDTLLGLAFFQSYPEINWVSASYYDYTDEPVFTPFFLFEKAGSTVGITGISSPPDIEDSRIIHKNWRSTLPHVLEKMQEQADFIILLSACPFSTNTEIASAFPQIDLIIMSSAGKTNMPPKLLNSSILTQTANRNQSIGRLIFQREDLKAAEQGKNQIAEIATEKKIRARAETVIRSSRFFSINEHIPDDEISTALLKPAL